MLVAAFLAALLLLVPAAHALEATYPRAWQPIVFDGALLPSLLGTRIDAIAALRCSAEGCVPIPFQVDERDAAGEWALMNGPASSSDESPGVLDENDAVVFLAADAGGAAAASAGRAGATFEVRLADPLGYPTRYVYFAHREGDAPRSPERYVSYDADRDVLRGSVELGFTAGVPQFLALTPGGGNVLDRLKIRATATFFWGLLRVTRSEEDLLPEAVSWSAGPVRVLRRQPLQIRMRFGMRSPRFVSTTYFYRDFAELPLTIRLRVPPRYFFTSITVRGGLDFRGLPGPWHVAIPGSDEHLPAGCRDSGATASRDDIAGNWFAVEGEQTTIVQRLHRGPSLESVRESVWYRNGAVDDPPENVAGQCPGVGFTLADWDGVEGGVHTLTSTSYAVARALGVGVFLATVETPLEVVAVPLAAAHP